MPQSRSSMGPNLSPVIHGGELKNLENGEDSHRSAIKALESCVKDLNTQTIPRFLAQVSAISEHGSSPGECSISLCEVLARVHGLNIVPHIDQILSSIIRTLSLSTGSFTLHEACSNVVAAVARYGIDPLTTENEKTRIIWSLAKPLSDVLMGPQESAASGAALCLQALLQSDNWRFASDDILNELCLKVAGALEETPTQTNSHMGFAMALVKQSNKIIEPYARSLVRSGLQILAAGNRDCDSHKQLSAIMMINILMECVDSRSISSEIPKVVAALERVRNDGMHSVIVEASEALKTAKWIVGQKGLSHEIFPNPISASKFKGETSRRHPWVAGNNEDARNPGSLIESYLPESQTPDSCIDCGNVVDLPLSTRNPDFACGRRVDRRLWNVENSRLDTELNDGFLTKEEISDNHCVTYFQQFRNCKLDEIHHCSEQEEPFPGSVMPTVNDRSQAVTSNPQRSSVGTKMSSSSQKLNQSVQSSSSVNSGRVEAPRREDSYLWNSNSELTGRNIAGTRKLIKQNDIQDKLSTDNIDSATSVSNFHTDGRAICGNKNHACMSNTRNTYNKAALCVLCCFSLIVFIILLLSRWIGSDDDFLYVVPT